jgi:hypothetical protein
MEEIHNSSAVVEECEHMNNGGLLTRKRKMRTFLEYPEEDWLIDPARIVPIIEKFVKKKESRILIPGVGNSRLPLMLFERGYKCLTLLDIETGAIEVQRSKFGDNTSVEIVQCDVLQNGFNIFERETFDAIIDKSFMDVFLRQGRSKFVYEQCLSKLRCDGVFVAFSIFHAKWTSMIRKHQFKNALYGSIHVPRFSRTRPNVQSFSNPIAVLVGESKLISDCKKTPRKKSGLSKSDVALSCGTLLSLSNLHALNKSTFPPDASHI